MGERDAGNGKKGTRSTPQQDKAAADAAGRKAAGAVPGSGTEMAEGNQSPPKAEVDDSPLQHAMDRNKEYKMQQREEQETVSASRRHDEYRVSRLKSVAWRYDAAPVNFVRAEALRGYIRTAHRVGMFRSLVPGPKETTTRQAVLALPVEDVAAAPVPYCK
ncbi:hypothetical protein DMN91_010678 [Ooceraea biroi]|uniref:Uncharacterized protein n=1 Tax=Ooceraea biroi TaxID=2015173 RepID=A0A3L8D7Z1_OOCBI|nr:hypothetical protein DMN91_010678 [Ooceraea biroi]